MILNKEKLEYILGRKLLNYEYDFFCKYIKFKRSNLKIDIYLGRQNSKTRLINECNVLNGVIPKNIIIDEFISERLV